MLYGLSKVLNIKLSATSFIIYFPEDLNILEVRDSSECLHIYLSAAFCILLTAPHSFL